MVNLVRGTTDVKQARPAEVMAQAHYALNLQEKEGSTESIRHRAQEVRAGKE
jgi:hypothetical protein